MSEKKTEYDHEKQQTFDQWKVCDSNNSGIHKIIDLCKKHQFLYKFISANDAGSTGSHQSGIYLPNSTSQFFFDTPGIKGERKERFVTIRWEEINRDTESRFIWYGEKTRREYRLTRFGKGFPYLKDEFIGSLMILVNTGKDELIGWILDSDNDIENFLARFSISHLDKGGVVTPERDVKESITEEPDQNRILTEFLQKLGGESPKGAVLSKLARQICAADKQPRDADEQLIQWLDTEYQVFRLIENKIHQPFIQTGNHSLEEILEFSLSVLNSRKSRAGKSLEYHLAAVFDDYKIPYSHGKITEGHSRPDFIFPGIKEYHDSLFSTDHLVFLGSKTTCKDRWRQILTEAKRVNKKHLFTLQQGVSSNQLEEMERENVTLVVPRQNLTSFPELWRPRLLTLSSFMQYVKTTIP